MGRIRHGIDDDLAAGEACGPVGPPTTKLPVRLTRKSEALFGIHPSGNAEAIVSAIISFTMLGVFLPLRCANCAEWRPRRCIDGLAVDILHGNHNAASGWRSNSVAAVPT